MIPVVKFNSDNELERENWFILMIHIFTEQKVLQLQKERGENFSKKLSENKTIAFVVLQL